VSSAEWLRPLPIGNAISVEATGTDALSAARLALVELAEQVPMSSVSSVTVTAMIIDPGQWQPWEATAYAALVE